MWLPLKPLFFRLPYVTTTSMGLSPGLLFVVVVVVVIVVRL